MFETDDLRSSNRYTISHQLSQIEEVSCAEQTDERTDEKTEERLSTKEAPSNQTQLVHEHEQTSQNQDESSSDSGEYTDEEYDYEIQLFKVHCNEFYNPIMEQILGSFNTEAPVRVSELEHYNEKV